MKNLLFGAVLLFSLSSCDKEETSPLENKKYPVQFNATGFTSEISPLKSGATESEDRFYAVFDSEQKFVKEIRFAANDQIKDELVAGNYTVFIGIANSYAGISKNQDNPNIENTRFYNGQFFTENYAGKLEFSVDENTSGNFPVVLNRMSGRLKIILEDEIPSKSTVTVDLPNLATFINIDNLDTFNHTDASFSYLNETDAALIPTWEIDFMPKFSILPDFENLCTVKLTCRDENDNILGIKTIENVRLERNTLTTLTGKLLSNDPNSTDSGFALTFNEDWNPAIEKTF